MKDVPIRTITRSDFPALLQEITDPPEVLYVQGTLPPEDYKLLCIVGSRKYTSYGEHAVEHLISGLAGYPISIISGLALGIDGLAHKEALQVGLHTIAVPGSGLSREVLYPRSHVRLADEIIESGGALVSEFEPIFKPTRWSFPQRNRIMAGLSHAILVIEAATKSGTLITARLAMEYNRDVLAVPGSIFSLSSEGPHSLIRDGAIPIRHTSDIIEALGLSHLSEELAPRDLTTLSDPEKLVYELLLEPLEKDVLIERLGLPVHKTNIILSAMELKGLIIERMGKVHKT